MGHDEDMPEKPDLTQPWTGDVNEAVRDEWKEETTAFERVTAVIDATTDPAFASAIAEQAAVSEPTARRHLTALVDVGRIEAVAAEQGTKYKRSANTLAMRRIAGLHQHYSKGELQQGLNDLRQKLQEFREKHGVNDPDDLATTLEPGSNQWTDVSRWRSVEENLKVAKAALSLYDFDPDDTGSATTRAESEEAPGDRTTGNLAGFDPGTLA